MKSVVGFVCFMNVLFICFCLRQGLFVAEAGLKHATVFLPWPSRWWNHRPLQAACLAERLSAATVAQWWAVTHKRQDCFHLGSSTVSGGSQARELKTLRQPWSLVLEKLYKVPTPTGLSSVARVCSLDNEDASSSELPDDSLPPTPHPHLMAGPKPEPSKDTLEFLSKRKWEIINVYCYFKTLDLSVLCFSAIDNRYMAKPIQIRHMCSLT